MRYAAFFRGLNVGGKHVVKMADQRRLFLDLGFGNVRTVIQSGNVLFATDREAQALPGMIGPAFEARFGFPGGVIVRSADEIAAILAALPFSSEEIARAEAANPEVTHVYIYLSDGEIDQAAAVELQRAYGGSDRIAAGKREAYLLCVQSVRKSKLAASLVNLNASLTARNLKTLRKILTLLTPGEQA